MKKTDVKDLIKRARKIRKDMDKSDPCYQPLGDCIKHAKDMLPNIKKELTSSQQEIYKKLEVAVGPGQKNYQCIYPGFPGFFLFLKIHTD